MSFTRVIPKLDIKGPNLIKAIEFDGHRVLGKVEDFAEIYYEEGADELIYQDTVASLYGRNGLLEIISKASSKIFIPLTVAGGLRSLEDISNVLRAGADKVGINTYAIKKPDFIKKAANEFGSQCIVSSIEAYSMNKDKYCVWTDYGREVTSIDALDWAKKVEDLGAGEILLSVINRDGRGNGFDIDLINKVSESVSIPVIASSGAGKLEHFEEVIVNGKADAVCAASCFHYKYAVKNIDVKKDQDSSQELRMGEHLDEGNSDFLNFGYGGERTITVERLSIKEVKKYLIERNILVRP